MGASRTEGLVGVAIHGLLGFFDYLHEFCQAVKSWLKVNQKVYAKHPVKKTWKMLLSNILALQKG